MEYRDHNAFMTVGPYSKHVVERRVAGKHPITMHRCKQPAGDFSDPAQPDLVLYWMLQSDSFTDRDHGAGHARHRFQCHDFDLLAPGAEAKIVANGQHEIIDVVLPMTAIREALFESHGHFDGDFGQLHARPFRNDFLRQTCQQLWEQNASDDTHGQLFADGALLTIVSLLLQAGRDAKVTTADNPVLSDGQIGDLTDFIDANLSRPVSVADLAVVADLPLFMFHQAFRKTMGVTPYRFVITRRIERAQELLLHSTKSILEISGLCGFTSQSHFGDAFKRKVGSTPGKFRKSRR